jgi:hypothetical protein
MEIKNKLFIRKLCRSTKATETIHTLFFLFLVSFVNGCLPRGEDDFLRLRFLFLPECNPVMMWNRNLRGRFTTKITFQRALPRY